MKLIVGLGNAGPEYEDTRHNLGFRVVEKIAKESEAEFDFDKKINAEIGKGRFNGKAVILAKPHTFVNKSGEAVKKLKTKYKLKNEDIVIVHDDLDIEFGNFKMSLGKDSGGHRGVQSIIDHLKTKKFWRLKIGTANRELTALRRQKSLKDKKQSVADFVLSQFTPAERTDFKKIVKKSIKRLENVL